MNDNTYSDIHMPSTKSTWFKIFEIQVDIYLVAPCIDLNRLIDHNLSITLLLGSKAESTMLNANKHLYII